MAPLMRRRGELVALGMPPLLALAGTGRASTGRRALSTGSWRSLSPLSIVGRSVRATERGRARRAGGDGHKLLVVTDPWPWRGLSARAFGSCDGGRVRRAETRHSLSCGRWYIMSRALSGILRCSGGEFLCGCVCVDVGAPARSGARRAARTGQTRCLSRPPLPAHAYAGHAHGTRTARRLLGLALRGAARSCRTALSTMPQEPPGSHLWRGAGGLAARTAQRVLFCPYAIVSTNYVIGVCTDTRYYRVHWTVRLRVRNFITPNFCILENIIKCLITHIKRIKVVLNVFFLMTK